MGAKEGILAVLRDPATSRLNFRYANVPVYPRGYKKIADLVEQDEINLRLSSNLGQAQVLAQMGVGVYQHATNTFILPSATFPGANTWVGALVVHEMTHALMDWHHETVNELDSEVAAYIAQAMWVQLKSNAQSEPALAQARQTFLGNYPRRDVRVVFEAAWELAKLARQPVGGYLIQPGPLVDYLKLNIVQLGSNGHNRRGPYHDSQRRNVAFDGFQ